MQDIESKTIQNLEGMGYNKSPAERDFGKSATFGIIVLFFTMLIHQLFKLSRFKQTRWMPEIDSMKISAFVRNALNIIEREIAPSLFCVAFCISVGAYYVWAAWFTFCLILNAGFLFYAYKT